MPAAPATLDVVRRAVRSVVEHTPELQQKPELRARLARHMVGVSAAAADLLDAERRFAQQVNARRRPRALAAAQAAGDIHKRTAVNSAAGVLQATKEAIDFPGFVTSLITGVFQAMTTSTIQQLEAYANLLQAINTSTESFAATGITGGRAATWAIAQFPQLALSPDDPPTLMLRDDAEMPDTATLRGALEATEDEVSEIDESELEETLLPLVRRKLARDRQAMLATMVLMGMNRIVVDAGRITASMELQVDARSTAEETEASRVDTRVTTSGSGSFGMGMWGASASLSATVGYVKSDQQFSREDIALRAGLRSQVEIGFHTEPIQLDRMAKKGARAKIESKSLSPETEAKSANLLSASPTGSLLGPDERKTKAEDFGPTPAIPDLNKEKALDPNSKEARDLRAKKNFDEKKDEPKPKDAENKAAAPVAAKKDAATDKKAAVTTDKPALNKGNPKDAAARANESGAAAVVSK